jgi:hypothetical protein
VGFIKSLGSIRFIEPKLYINPTKDLIEPKLYMNPTKDPIEPKFYMTPTKNLIELTSLKA